VTVSFRARIDGTPTEEELQRLIVGAREAGAEDVLVETTREAGDAWVRAGFTEVSRTLAARVDTLEAKVAGERGASAGSIHLQSDDAEAIADAVRAYVPRLPGGSRGSVVLPPRDGWTSVYDELCDREPEMLRRLATELSNRSGALVLALGVEEGAVVRYIALDRGRVVDEYLSVPEHYGPLPPGEVVALGSNPRLMARLTGADPERVRQVARTADLPAELPPAAELAAELAATFGLPDGPLGYARARSVPGAIGLPRGS
jgi:hypothetical protein